jgi:hypothetical protein
MSGLPEEAADLTPKLHAMLRGKVAAGPFAGMSYIAAASGSEICPKLLGTYEMELWPVVTEAVKQPYDLFVDLGAGEGYYAVGMARAMPEMKVIAFEAGDEARTLLAEMVQLNAVADHVWISGAAAVGDVQRSLSQGQRTLLLCDVEGAEVELLNPKLAPALENADILVELHDSLRPGTSRLIRERFAHRPIEKFSRKARHVKDCPWVNLTPRQKMVGMWENRAMKQDWFWMPVR